jgi:BlaI family transcriptional regulator, penicillinase repressor
MKTQISNAEWEVMRLVWEKAPVPASDIVAQLQTRHDWQASTVRTLIGRLVKKRALRALRDGKRFLFSARLGKDECIQKESRSLAERVFGGEPAAMLIHLVKATPFTSQELSELRQILDEKTE